MRVTDALTERFRRTVQTIPEDVRKGVNNPGGLSEYKLLELILNPQDQSLDRPDQPDDVCVRTECDIEACTLEGRSVLDAGQVAFCILAGGVGTRIGEPKALLRLPDLGLSLLTIKLFQAIGTGPIWIMTSPSLKQQIVDHVNSQIGIDHNRITYVEQYESYRLHPNNDVVLNDGVPELYPCGHGDIFPALTLSGILDGFLSRGGKYVSVVNVDNLLASLDPMLVGWHILSTSNVTCEVVERRPNDSGGFLCVDRGQPQIAESFRLRGVNQQEFKWLNTNSLIFNANLNIKPLGNSWNRVQKKVNDRLVIQHERLLQEITEAYDSMYVRVVRDERFFPIKSLEDLQLASSRLNLNKHL